MTEKRLAEARPLLAELDDGQRAVAMHRFGVLRPHLEGGAQLVDAAAAGSVSVRTVQRWLAAYRSGGLAALAPKARSDRGTRRVAPELVALVEALALRRPKPSAFAPAPSSDTSMTDPAHDARPAEPARPSTDTDPQRPTRHRPQLRAWPTTPKGAPHQDGTAMPEPDGFLVTKQYRRFAEFCDAVRRERYIGLCYGPPGVGKTISARHYTNWDQLQPLYRAMDISYSAGLAASASRSVLYTPTVTATPRQLQHDLSKLRSWLSFVMDRADDDHDVFAPRVAGASTELVIVDEADRLKHQTLEQLRDHFDRTGTGIVLIGMPGIEKRLARYPQLYSRIGFAHQYHPLSTNELEFVLQHHYQQLGLTLSADDFTDNEAISAVAHITNGNFRLIQRLFAQITRILEINNLTTITKQVVETARENLVIGGAPNHPPPRQITLPQTRQTILLLTSRASSAATPSARAGPQDAETLCQVEATEPNWVCKLKVVLAICTDRVSCAS